MQAFFRADPRLRGVDAAKRSDLWRLAVGLSEQNVARRVTRKGAKPGETELVDVKGRIEPSSKNKSGWSVRMTITPAKAPPGAR